MTELIGDLTESDLLRRILARTPSADTATVGPGDDAAVLALRGDLVATTDTLVHGPDFRLAWSSGFDLGYKAAAVNLADVAAMGARPTALLVALAIPASLPVSLVEEMAEGLASACAALAPGCAVVGGDLTVSATLTIAVTALGDLEGRAAVLRSGARPGDTLALAGTQGNAARGLSTLFRRFTDTQGAPTPLDLTALTAVEQLEVMAQLRPEPPIALGIVAAVAGATAMMDVSDGLVLDARRMARASGVTLEIDSSAFENAASALEGGEDHPLLATFTGALPDGFRAIGRVVAAGDEAVLVDGARHDLPGGWDPYRDWDAQAG